MALFILIYFVITMRIGMFYCAILNLGLGFCPVATGHLTETPLLNF